MGIRRFRCGLKLLNRQNASLSAAHKIQKAAKT